MDVTSNERVGTRNEAVDKFTRAPEFYSRSRWSNYVHYLVLSCIVSSCNSLPTGHFSPRLISLYTLFRIIFLGHSVYVLKSSPLLPSPNRLHFGTHPISYPFVNLASACYFIDLLPAQGPLDGTQASVAGIQVTLHLMGIDWLRGAQN